MRLLRRRETAPGTIHDGIEYTSRVVLPTEERSSRNGRKTSLNRGYTRLRGAHRRLSNAVIALSLMMVAVFGVAAPAQAAWWDNLIEATCPPPVMYADAVGDSFAWLRPKTDPARFNDVPRTAYEKYGMSGLRVSYFLGEKDAAADSPFARPDGGCHQVETRMDGWIANAAFKLNAFGIGLTNWLFETAFSVGDTMETIMRDFIVEFAEVFREAMYFEFLGVILMLGAVHAGWVGLVKRQSATAAQAFFWMVGSVMVGSLMLFSPLKTTDLVLGFVNESTGAVGTAMARYAAQSVPTDSLCYLPTAVSGRTGDSGSGGSLSGGTAQVRHMSGTEHAVRTMQCVYWETFTFRPWVQAQFGVAYDDPVLREHMGTVRIGNRDVPANLALRQFDAQSLDYSIVGDRNAVKREKFQQWSAVKDDVAQTSAWSDWRGDDSGIRYGIPLTAWVGSLVAGFLIVILSGAMVVYKIGFLIAVAVTPIFLLLGAHPGMGRRMVLGFVQDLVGRFMKLIGISLSFGIVIAFFLAIQNSALSNNNYGGAIMMMTLGAIALFTIGRKVLGLISDIRFAGAGQSGTEGSAGISRIAKQTGTLLGGAALGAVAGTAGAAAATKAGGLGAGARVMAKSAAEGAQRGAYARSGMSGAFVSARAGQQTAKTEAFKVKSQAAMRAASKTEPEPQKDDLKSYTAEQARLDDLIREARRHEGDAGFAARFEEEHNQTPSAFLRDNPRTSTEALKEQRKNEVREYEENKDNPEYIANLKHRHGGTLPTYLSTEAERRRYYTPPKPESDSARPKPKTEPQEPVQPKPSTFKPSASPRREAPAEAAGESVNEASKTARPKMPKPSGSAQTPRRERRSGGLPPRTSG